MRIGYLHLSPKQDHESGVTRYGRYLSTALAALPQVEIQQIAVVLNPSEPFEPSLAQALQGLAHCDVLHLQYSKYIGLVGWQKLKLLRQIRQGFSGRICVTLHDVYLDLYPKHGVRADWRYHHDRLRSFSNYRSLALRSTAVYVWQNHLADKAIMRWLLKQVDLPLVCHQAEAERLQHFEGGDRIQVLPHFVEERQGILAPEAAKQALGIRTDRRLVTLQGFIYRGKGHELLLEALTHLPESIQVVFAGGMAPNQASYERELKAKIEALGVGDRIQITGYLSEAQLERYLAASDLAVCPFKILSASGSIATWISMGRPILAYDLPQVRELNQLVPQAIHTFEHYSPEALAAAIQDCLHQQTNDDATRRIEQLRAKLSPGAIASAHLEMYRDLLSGALERSVANNSRGAFSASA